MSKFNRELAETIKEMLFDSHMEMVTIEEIAKRHFKDISLHPALIELVAKSLRRAKGYLDRADLLVALVNVAPDGRIRAANGRYRPVHGITNNMAVLQADLKLRAKRAGGAVAAVSERAACARSQGVIDNASLERTLESATSRMFAVIARNALRALPEKTDG